MSDDAATVGWLDLLRPEWIPSLVVLLGGVLLYSMNVLLMATVLPSIVEEVGGAALMSWATTAYLATSIVAASCTGLLAAAIGAGRAFCGGALVFFVGTLICAIATSMEAVIVGRFVQGLGCGLLSAMAYVLVRQVFPEPAWPRVFAALAAVWGVSVLVGPLIGGVFAYFDNWRGAFFAVAAVALMLGATALKALPHRPRAADQPLPPMPGLRVALLCLAIVVMSVAAIGQTPLARGGLILLTLALLVVMLRLDRTAEAPLLPRDAFSLRTATGVGLWVALLVSFAFNPLSIYGPMFLQRLHGFDPLTAGYAIAAASMAWTVAAVVVAGFTGDWPNRTIVLGPVVMAGGLLGVALLMPYGPVIPLCVAISAAGLGIGSCWAFTAQRVMSHARAGEEAVAASSVPTIQQAGLALGAAVSGLIANAVGLSGGLEHGAVLRAAFWVPVAFVGVAVLAALMGLHLRILVRHAEAVGKA